jgi:hypothetical protein
MLGRGIGVSEERLSTCVMALCGGIYTEAEAATIRRAQKSTKLLHINDSTYQALAKHFSVPQITEILVLAHRSMPRIG